MSHTGNPRADQLHPSEAPREPTGAVAADSLAAESFNNSGGFSQNENAAPLSVKGNQSTLNNTDTSGATTLHSAESGAVREKQDALGAGADEKGTAGLKLDALDKAEFTGQHSLQGYSGGPSGGAAGIGAPVSQGNVKAGDSDFGATTGSSSDSKDSNIRSTGEGFSGGSSSTTTTETSGSGAGSGGPAAGGGVRPYVDAAPNYTAPAFSEGTFKPKGANLEDADATESMPKPKTFTGDVGGVHDPGRLAERDFEGRNTDPNTELGQAGEEGGKQRNTGGAGSGGQYDVLESERA